MVDIGHDTLKIKLYNNTPNGVGGEGVKWISIRRFEFPADGALATARRHRAKRCRRSLGARGQRYDGEVVLSDGGAAREQLQQRNVAGRLLPPRRPNSVTAANGRKSHP